MSELLALGISHKTAPVALRERLALTDAARPSASCASSWRSPASARRSRSRPATAPRSTSSRATRSRPRPRCSGMLARKRRHPPDRAGRPRLLAAQLRRRAPSLPRDQRPGVDDRRRGRGPGPGQARLRGRARRRHDRPAHEPPVPRRAADRQARAHARPRSASGRASVSSVAVELAREAVGDLERPRRRDHRRRRDGRADRARARRAGRRARSSSPTAAPTARASLAERFGGQSCRSTSCPTQLAAADIVVCLDLLAARDRRRGGARRRDGARATAGRCC